MPRPLQSWLDFPRSPCHVYPQLPIQNLTRGSRRTVVGRSVAASSQGAVDTRVCSYVTLDPARPVPWWWTQGATVAAGVSSGVAATTSTAAMAFVAQSWTAVTGAQPFPDG